MTKMTKTTKPENVQVRLNREIKQRLVMYVAINGGSVSGAAIAVLDKHLPELPVKIKKS